MRFLGRVSSYCLALGLVFSPQLHAKTLESSAKWFASGGKATEVKAELDGREVGLEEALAHMGSRDHELELARALPLIAAQVRSDKIPCIVRDGMFQYRKRDPARRLSPDQQWSPWAEDDNRNLRWAHQGLSLAGCYLRMLDGDSAQDAERDLKALLADWYAENAVVDLPDKEFSWGDHTIAFRLRRTVAIYLELRERGLLDQETSELLLRMAYSHTRILLEEREVRMRQSNHALDQAQALFLSGMAFPFLKYSRSPVREAYNRAMYEGEFLIAADGVQTENSPAYHQWVPNKVFSLITAMAEHLEEPLPDDFVAKMSGAARFATWITRPDGTLPPIGDTGSGAPSKFRATAQVSTELRENLAFAQSGGKEGAAPKPGLVTFEKSGYLIYRNRWSKGDPSQDVHLVLKCGFLSHGHRHDDDGSVVLYGFGTDWLTDGGLYGYEHNSPERKYVTSPLAHNVSVPLGAASVSRMSAQRYQDNHERWGLAELSRNGATCNSYMYQGIDYARTISLGTDGMKLLDRFSGAEVDQHRLVSLFRVSSDKSIEVDKNDGHVDICHQGGRCLRIDYDAGSIDDVVVSTGTDQYGFSFDTDGYLKTRPVQTVRLFWKEGETASSYRLQFSDISAFGAGIAPAVAVPGSAVTPEVEGPRLLPLLLGVAALFVLQLLVVKGGWRGRWTIAWFVGGLSLGVVVVGWWIAPPRYLPSAASSRVVVALAEDLKTALLDPEQPEIVFIDGGSYSARGVDPNQMETRLEKKTGRAFEVIALALPGANQTERRVLLDDALSLLPPDQRARLHDAKVTLLLEVHNQYDRYPLQQLAENPRSDRALAYVRPKVLWRVLRNGLGPMQPEKRRSLVGDAMLLGSTNALNVGIATRVDPVETVLRADSFAGLRRADKSFKFKGLKPVIAAVGKRSTEADYPMEHIKDRREHIVSSLGASDTRIIYFSVPSTAIHQVRYAEGFCRDQVRQGAGCIDHANRWLLRKLNHRKYWYDAGHLLEEGAAQYTRWLTDRMILEFGDDPRGAKP